MMAQEELSQQLEEWKTKYYQSITDLEQQQSYDELLQRSLGRLALAAQGLDPKLDTQLQSLRSVLRGKNNKDEISSILEKMEKAIARMESGKKSDQTLSSGEILADLLKSLKLAKPFKSEAKTLTKKLNKADPSELSPLVDELLLLLDKALTASSTSQSEGLGFKLFGFGKSDKNTNENVDIDINVDQNENTEEDTAETPPNLVLMQLLERLALPTDLSKKATKIRHKIEHGLDDEKLPAIINDIAEIVSSLGSQAVAEKHEYEEFLKTLTSRLNELDKHIRQTSDEDSKAFKERNIISKAVTEQVTGLRSHVDQANDLEDLKSSINGRLDELNQHFDKYQQSDHDRFEQSQRQIKALNTRLHDMEQESNVLRESAEQSRKLALKDALTGIWNRQALNENLEKEFSRWQRYQKPLSLVIWDIDLFKKVNDNYGHAAGDKVLKTIARIFNQATRDADFIARFGGEEFVGIFPETRLEDALKLANKIREKIATSKFHYENRPVPITASAGLATFRPNDTIDDVFKRADTALYRSKESGRNRCSVEDN